MRKRWRTAAAIACLLTALPGIAAKAADYRQDVAAAPSRAEVERAVVREALRAGISPDLALAVAKVESGFNPAALSSAGARGVMQIMPTTARAEFGVERDLLWNANLNIRLGCAYLRMLTTYYGREDLALSHYYGGSRVGPPPFSRVIPETRDYVELVLAWKERFAEQGTARQLMAGLDPQAIRPVNGTIPSPGDRPSREARGDGSPSGYVSPEPYLPPDAARPPPRMVAWHPVPVPRWRIRDSETPGGGRWITVGDGGKW